MREFIIMSVLRVVICLFSICVHSYTFALDNNQKVINQDMTKLSNIIQELTPYLLDKDKFRESNNADHIQNNIDLLLSLFQDVKEHSDNRPVTFQISYNILYRQLKQAQQAFAGQNTDYARALLFSLPSACVTCHQQDRHFQTHRHILKPNKEQLSSDFELAEFYFLTRNYDKAVYYYNKYVYSPNKEDSKLQVSIEKQLSVYLQIYKDPKRSMALLATYINRASLPEYLKRDIYEWQTGLSVVQETFRKQSASPSFPELQAYISRYFQESESLPSSLIIPKADKMFYLMLSGYLYDYLYANPKGQESSKVLYWLALCDRALDYNYTLPLADLYLQECIHHDPLHPYAKKCLAEYEEYINFAYSGSRGTDIPQYLSKTLEDLNKLIVGAI
jgi:hypothetical protein